MADTEQSKFEQQKSLLEEIQAPVSYDLKKETEAEESLFGGESREK